MQKARDRLTRLEAHQEFTETDRVKNFEKIWEGLRVNNDNLLDHMLQEGGIISKLQGEIVVIKIIGAIIATALVGQLVLMAFK